MEGLRDTFNPDSGTDLVRMARRPARSSLNLPRSKKGPKYSTYRSLKAREEVAGEFDAIAKADRVVVAVYFEAKVERQVRRISLEVKLCS